MRRLAQGHDGDPRGGRQYRPRCRDHRHRLPGAHGAKQIQVNVTQFVNFVASRWGLRRVGVGGLEHGSY